MAKKKEVREQLKKKKAIRTKIIRWAVLIIPIITIGIVFTWLYQTKDIARRVGSEVIRERELQLEMDRLKPPNFDQQLGSMEPQDRRYALDTLRSNALRNLMKLKAVYLYASENNIRVTNEDIQREIDLFIEDLKLSTGMENVDFRHILADYGIPYRSFVADMRKQAVYNKVLDPVREAVTVTEDEIIDFYQQYKEYYDMPDQAKVKMISVEMEQEAIEIMDLLLEGEDFGKLARERSLSPDALQNSGDIGWVTPGELYKEIADNVFHEDIEFGMPYIIQARDGFYIIKVTDRKTATESTFDDVRELVKQDLLRNKGDRAVDSYMNDLVNEYKPRISDGNPWIDFLKWLDGLRGRL